MTSNRAKKSSKQLGAEESAISSFYRDSSRVVT